jgi:hypothetical protein
MPPGSFGGVILEGTGASAFGAAALDVGVVLELDFDAEVLEIEVNGLYEPVLTEAEQQFVML